METIDVDEVIDIILSDDKLIKYVMKLVRTRMTSQAQEDLFEKITIIDDAIHQVIKEVNLQEILEKIMENKHLLGLPNMSQNENSSFDIDSKNENMQINFQPHFSQNEPSHVATNSPKRMLKTLNKNKLFPNDEPSVEIEAKSKLEINLDSILENDFSYGDSDKQDISTHSLTSRADSEASTVKMMVQPLSSSESEASEIHVQPNNRNTAVNSLLNQTNSLQPSLPLSLSRHTTTVPITQENDREDDHVLCESIENGFNTKKGTIPTDDDAFDIEKELQEYENAIMQGLQPHDNDEEEYDNVQSYSPSHDNEERKAIEEEDYDHVNQDDDLDSGHDHDQYHHHSHHDRHHHSSQSEGNIVNKEDADASDNDDDDDDDSGNDDDDEKDDDDDAEKYDDEYEQEDDDDDNDDHIRHKVQQKPQGKNTTNVMSMDKFFSASHLSYTNDPVYFDFQKFTDMADEQVTGIPVKRVSFSENIIAEVYYRDRVSDQEKPALFYTHEEESQFNEDQLVETEDAERMGLTWNQWVEHTLDEDDEDEANEQHQQFDDYDGHSSYRPNRNWPIYENQQQYHEEDEMEYGDDDDEHENSEAF
jgi:hypothetical protein